jgi:hypothetical protein
MTDLAKELAGLTPKQRVLLELRLRRRESGAGGAPGGVRIPRRTETGGLLAPSFAQQRLWFIDQLQPGSVFFNISMALRLTGALDAVAFARSLTEIVRRHEVLRTTFRTVDGQPFQIVGPPREFPLGSVDLSGLDAAAREARLRELVAAEECEPFDLARGPLLLRARLVRLAAEEHAVLFTIHHIICDGLSMEILVREAAALYAAYATGRPSPLAELPIQYADYSVWQRERLSGEEFDRQLSYWRAELEGLPPTLDLDCARPRPAHPTHRGATHRQTLSPALADALRELSRREGVTVFITLLAAFKALLFYHSGREDLVVGSPLANRNYVELENLIGFFANPLVLRTRLAGDPTFRGLVGRVNDVSLGAHAHQELPFQKLVEALRIERDLGRHPLFQISFTLDSPRAQAVADAGDLKISPLDLRAETTQHELTLHVVDAGAGAALTCFWQYSTDLFDAAAVRAMADEFALLLTHVERRPEARLGELKALLAEREAARRVERGRDAAEASLHKLKTIRRRAVGVAGAAPARGTRE